MGRIATARFLALLLWGGATVQAALGPATEVGHAYADRSAPCATRLREGLRDLVVDLTGPAPALPDILPGPIDAGAGQVPPRLVLSFRLPAHEARHGYRVTGDPRHVHAHVGEAPTPGPAILREDSLSDRGDEDPTVRVTPGRPLAGPTGTAGP